MKVKLFIFVICIQLSLIFFLYKHISEKQKNTLGVSVNIINSDTIVKTPTKGLTFFYEPKANSKEVVVKKWLNTSPVYTINNDSLNERYNYSLDKELSTYRIITLGDSFTFGQNVSTERNWTELLEDELNRSHTCSAIAKYEVINLGVGGYDTQYEIERYKRRGVKYKPDLLLWYIIDLERITEKILPKLHNKDESALEQQGIFFSNWKKAIDEIKTEYGESAIYAFQMNQMNSIRDLYTGPIVFMGVFEAILKPKLQGEQLYFVDSNPDWDKPNKWLLDRHPSEEGHKEIAQKTLTFLLQQNLIPCK